MANRATAAQRIIDTAYLNPLTALEIPISPSSSIASRTRCISDTALACPTVLGMQIALL